MSSRPKSVSYAFDDTQHSSALPGDQPVLAKPSNSRRRMKELEAEEKYNKGWEEWVHKMGGDATDSDANFEAEELATRLSTKVSKTTKNNAKTLLQKIYHFWHCKHHTDMILVAENAREEVHLHMFLAHTEFYEKVVLIPDCEKVWREGKLVLDLTGLVVPSALKLIVAYVYTGALKITMENVTDLAVAAKAMGLRRLQEQCREFLDYIFADVHLLAMLRTFPKEHKFHDVAWTKILKRFRKVYKDQSFLELEPHLLESLLSSEKLEIDSEYQAFKAAIAWMNHDRPKRSKHFFTLMAQVRFAYMDIDELINCMQDEELFKTNCEAQKMLEDANIYATMDSMGDTWAGYPPFPPRNEKIRRKVEVRKLDLAKARNKTIQEICRENSPGGCTVPSLTRSGSDVLGALSFEKLTLDADIKAARAQAEIELFGLEDSLECLDSEPQFGQIGQRKPESPKLYTNKHGQAMDTDYDVDSVESDEESSPHTPSRAPSSNDALENLSFGPSEISLPSCIVNSRRPL